MFADLSRCEGGATALEFALVAPLLFFLLFAGVETSRFLFTAAAFDHALAVAARCATTSRERCATTAAVEGEFAAALDRLSSGRAAHDRTLVFRAQPCGLLIEAQASYRPLVAPLFPGSGVLKAQACAQPA